jgi:cyclopropane fatty-acyl-phospholipid synthase-like methyltransferase
VLPRIHRRAGLVWPITILSFHVFPLCVEAEGADADEANLARRILAAAEIRGGLIVHVGCGDGRLTAALRAGDGCLVHGLDADADTVQRAREHIQSRGLYGQVSVDSSFAGRRLPYVDNLVNLVVVTSDKWQVASEEITRVHAKRRARA